MGETRVDLQHLLEDLRDAYAGALEETIIAEILANALDAGATTIAVLANPAASALTVVDDGRGMQRRELARYHDVAASSKKRGEGIGFAGVGIKLGLLVSSEVLTETRRGKTHVASSWHLVSRYRAPWKWVAPAGLVASRGTAVRLRLSNPLSPLLDPGFLEGAIRRHFEPLLDLTLETLLKRHYPKGVLFEVDGRLLVQQPRIGLEQVPVAIRLARRRTPSAAGYLARSATPLTEDQQGIGISTLGKVIKRGWDWLGVAPAASDRVTGLVEVPDLAGCLTLNKNDFLRAGPRGATYLAYRKSLQEAVTRQLAAWGDARTDADTPRAVRLDRDLERVLEDLAGEFPLLHSLVERRTGGQKRLPMPDGREGDAYRPLFSLIRGAGEDHAEPVPPSTEPWPAPEGESAPAPPHEQEPAPRQDHEPPQPQDHDASHEAGALPGSGSMRRRTRYGLSLQFERRADDDELGRLVENTIWINEAHPAFQRAQASRSIGYHVALTVALALAPLAVAPAEEHLFLTRFLAEWGSVHAPRTRPAPRRPRRR